MDRIRRFKKRTEKKEIKIQQLKIWVDVEMYLYGQIVEYGGKNSSTIHLDTDEYGLIIIDASKDQLASFTENMIYKTVGIRAIVKQNLINFEMDKAKIKFCSMDPYSTEYDSVYVDELLSHKSGWSEVADPDEWLRKYRDGDEKYNMD